MRPMTKKIMKNGHIFTKMAKMNLDKAPKNAEGIFNGALPKVVEVTDFVHFAKVAFPIRGMHTFEKVAPKI